MVEKMTLTSKQKELFEFIESELIAKGVAPSFDEMKNHLGLSSKSGVHRLVSALEERGYIRKSKNRARCMRLVRGRSFKSDTRGNVENLLASMEKQIAMSQQWKKEPQEAIKDIAVYVRAAKQELLRG